MMLACLLNCLLLEPDNKFEYVQLSFSILMGVVLITYPFIQIYMFSTKGNLIREGDEVFCQKYEAMWAGMKTGFKHLIFRPIEKLHKLAYVCIILSF